MNNDLISRKALLDDFRHTITENSDTFDWLNMIARQPAVKKDDGWIPVEERIPEDGTYLCTLDGELCGIEEPFTGMCGIENGIWDEPDCVIAWCPLPEPYQPKPQNKPEDHYPDWRAKLLNKFDRRE